MCAITLRKANTPIQVLFVKKGDKIGLLDHKTDVARQRPQLQSPRFLCIMYRPPHLIRKADKSISKLIKYRKEMLKILNQSINQYSKHRHTLTSFLMICDLGMIIR